MKEDLKNYFSDLIKDIKSIKRETIFEIMKKRGKLLIILALVILMFLGFGIGRINTSKEHLLSKLEVALKNESSNKLSSIAKFNNKKVSKKEVQPLINYYSKDNSRVDSLINKLKTVGETEDLKLVEENRVFGTRCYIDIKPYSLKIDSEFKDSRFTIDDKNYINAGSKIDKLIPGVYTVKGILESGFGDIEASKEIVLMKDEEIDMEFDAVMLNISSVFYDAEVFANGQSTGILVKDAKNIGPFPTTGEVKLHIEKEFPWGRVKGEEVKVKDIPNLTLNLSMENETLKSEINTVVDEFYRGVFLSLNEEDKSVIKGGTENAINKIYDVLEKKYFILKNKYNIKDIRIVEDKNQYRYEDGIYSATIVVSVDYTVSKSFLGLNKEESNKLFFTKMIYNGKEWKVEDVENFSL
ncbi:TcaA 3rd/4th domain-containing protein [Clostridium paraputrificum]|uniref:TcaA 3rd/4th domain-containing protein n=1 Tax=Clostridium paraputrificum TaxID=29363 RepID=UPI0034A4F6F5